jgi:hypothetical protein
VEGDQSAERHASVVTRIAGLALTVLAAAALIEAGSWFAVTRILEPRQPSLFYRPPRVSEEEFRHYLEVRDPALGWPSPAAFGSAAYDRSGSRPVPAFPRSGGECVALFGDSFTYGEGVGDADTWGNLLAVALGCRVANFGVPGYGTDQAYLRYLRIGAGTASLVILGITPWDVERNVNQYFYLLGPTEVLGLKPRFLLGRSGLTLVPLPTPTYDAFQRAAADPSSLFQHETFLPGSRFGPLPVRFPYTALMLRTLLSRRVLNHLARRPSWVDFFSPGDPSQALQITTEIASAFCARASQHGQACLVVLFPSGSSYKDYVRSGKVATSALAEALRARGIVCLDLHHDMREALAGEDYCRLLADPRHCEGHYNEAGNHLMTRVLLRFLKEQRLVF